MPKSRRFRIAVTLLAAFAATALAVLPAVHVHQKASGGTLVHSHVVAVTGQHAGLEHGDHHDGLPTLEPAFTFVRTVHVEAPNVGAPRLLVAPPVVGVRRAALFDAPVLHGPPPRILSPRAPPL